MYKSLKPKFLFLYGPETNKKEKIYDVYLNNPNKTTNPFSLTPILRAKTRRELIREIKLKFTVIKSNRKFAVKTFDISEPIMPVALDYFVIKK